MKYFGPNVFLYFSSLTANFLSVVTAAVFSWTSPIIPKLYSNDTNINPLGQPITASQESLLASLQTVGAIVGSIISGIIAEKVGRKKTLILFSLTFAASHLMLALAKSIYLYHISRLVMGLGAGTVLTVLPSFVGEIAENSNRGSLGSLFGIMSCIGHFTCFGIGPVVSIQTFSYIQLIPLGLFFILFVPFVPESPYYYLAKDNDNKAMESLEKLRKNTDVIKELLYLKDVVKEEKANKVSLRELTLPATRNGLLVSCGILILQTFTGIPIILLFLQMILEASGNVVPASIASLVIGLVQIFACIISGLVIDKVGRKMLLYISSTGCSVSLAALGTFFMLQDRNYNMDKIFWLPFASLINFYLLFNIGYGPIPWAICGELFASNVKSVCVSITGAVALAVGLVVAATFPFIRNAFGMSGVFFVFSGLSALSVLFVWLVVPETKGKSFQEIQNALSRKK